MAKYDIFISYSRRDIKQVNKFVEMLKERCEGIRIWFDINGIESGEEFEDKIVEAIDNSERVLFFMSENALEAKWTKDEIRYAINAGKKLIPILLDGCTLKGWYLFRIGKVDCIEANKPEQIQKLIRDLNRDKIKEKVDTASKIKSEPAIQNNKKQKIGIYALIAAIVILGIVVFLLSTNNKSETETEIQEIEQPVSPTLQRVNNLEFTNSLGTTFTYTGEVNDDNVPNGYGTGIYKEGTYTGEYKDGLRQGEATYTTKDGSNVFEGTYNNDMYEKGKLLIKHDGSYYEGTFKNNDLYNGTLYNSDGTVAYQIVNGKY